MRVILPTLLCFGLTRLAGAPLEPAKSSGVEFERAYAVVIQAPATTVNVVFEDKAHYRRVDWDRTEPTGKLRIVTDRGEQSIDVPAKNEIIFVTADNRLVSYDAEKLLATLLRGTLSGQREMNAVFQLLRAGR